MRPYRAGLWGVNLWFIFSADGSVIPRASVPGGCCAVLTFVLHTFCFGNLHVTDSVLDMWSGYTFVLGFLIVFRNNLAYSRFWDGSGLIMRTRGEWFNVVSSVFAFCATTADKAETVKEFQVKIVRLFSMLFFAALQEIADIDVGDFEVIDMTGMESVSRAFLSGRSDKSEVIMQWVQRAIVDAQHRGILAIPPPILSRSFQELSRGMVNLVDVKKIKDIPFPYPYAQVATIMLLVYSVMTATFTSQHVESRFWACLLSYVVCTAFWALNYIAMELEQPFGVDPNDLPLKDILGAMNESLLVLLHPVMQTCPEIEAHATQEIAITQWAQNVGAAKRGNLNKSSLPPSLRTVLRLRGFGLRGSRKQTACTTPKCRQQETSFSVQVEEALRQPIDYDALRPISSTGATPRPSGLCFREEPPGLPNGGYADDGAPEMIRGVSPPFSWRSTLWGNGCDQRSAAAGANNRDALHDQTASTSSAAVGHASSRSKLPDHTCSTGSAAVYGSKRALPDPPLSTHDACANLANHVNHLHTNISLAKLEKEAEEDPPPSPHESCTDLLTHVNDLHTIATLARLNVQAEEILL